MEFSLDIIFIECNERYLSCWAETFSVDSSKHNNRLIIDVAYLMLGSSFEHAAVHSDCNPGICFNVVKIYIVQDKVIGIAHQVVIAASMNAHVLLFEKTYCMTVSWNWWFSIWL
jgi:hypothetical protein